MHWPSCFSHSAAAADYYFFHMSYTILNLRLISICEFEFVTCYDSFVPTQVRTQVLLKLFSLKSGGQATRHPLVIQCVCVYWHIAIGTSKVQIWKGVRADMSIDRIMTELPYIQSNSLRKIIQYDLIIWRIVNNQIHTWFCELNHSDNPIQTILKGEWGFLLWSFLSYPIS